MFCSISLSLNPSSISGPIINGLVPTHLFDWPAFVGSPAEVSIDSPNINASKAWSGFNLTTGGTISFLLVINIILFAFSKSIVSSVFGTSLLNIIPLPFEVKLTSSKSTFPSS